MIKRSAGKNPYPGVSRNKDRHGRSRWRVRLKGLPQTYLPGEYGSAEFRAAYENVINGERAKKAEPGSRHAHGTFDWLIEQYKQTPTWEKMAPISLRNLQYDLDRFSRDHGERTVAGLKSQHVEAVLAKKAATPAAANKLLKLIKRLCRFAIRRGIISIDPTVGVDRYNENPDGFHTWTEAEIVQFEQHHGSGSKAVLALQLMLCTGAARQDVCLMGFRNLSGHRISYARGKTGGFVDLPILPQLEREIEFVPAGQGTFLIHTGDRPYKPETFGNWFRDQCSAANLPHCSSHGLRKAGATRLADAGATEFEIMAFLGHKTPAEARTYTKKANRRVLADSGMRKLTAAKAV